MSQKILLLSRQPLMMRMTMTTRMNTKKCFLGLLVEVMVTVVVVVVVVVSCLILKAVYFW